MGRLVRMVGSHDMAAVKIPAGRHAGRHAIAYRFYGAWRFVTDEDTGDLLTWKTEEEALGIAEAWRRRWDTVRLPGEPRNTAAK
ncbi:MAG: hypothetical protein IVW57_09150 [Ktedonobacterales bacterium]|nr:hypothetical protein [Ktedonobacterales bacterium]